MWNQVNNFQKSATVDVLYFQVMNVIVYFVIVHTRRLIFLQTI